MPLTLREKARCICGRNITLACRRRLSGLLDRAGRQRSQSAARRRLPRAKWALKVRNARYGWHLETGDPTHHAEVARCGQLRSRARARPRFRKPSPLLSSLDFPLWAEATTLPLNGYSIRFGRTLAERALGRRIAGTSSDSPPVDGSSPFLMLLLTFAGSSMLIV